MIEYTIEVRKILKESGEVVVFLHPTNSDLSPLRHVLQVSIAKLAAMTPADALDYCRVQLIRLNDIFQWKWGLEAEAKAAVLTDELLAAEGRTFPVVTADEVEALKAQQAAQEGNPTAEVVI
jgi:hypothetical protein